MTRRDFRIWIESGRWIPWSFVAMLGLVVLANGAMVVLAFASWPGLVTRSAFEAGLDQDARLAEEAAQTARGWRLKLTATTKGAGRLDLAVELEGPDGRPLEAEAVEAVFTRPTQEGLDRAETLTARGPGRFSTQLTLPLPGVWDVAVTARRGEETRRARQRLFLAP